MIQQYRPFSSSLVPLFQSESKGENDFDLHENETASRTHFHMKGHALKPWPNGPASSREWTQVELVQRLALGGQTARKFLREYTQVAKKDILRQTIPYFIG